MKSRSSELWGRGSLVVLNCDRRFINSAAGSNGRAVWSLFWCAVTGSGNCLLPDSAKSLSESMLTNCQMDRIRLFYLQSWKFYKKCRSPNCGHLYQLQCVKLILQLPPCVVVLFEIEYYLPNRYPRWVKQHMFACVLVVQVGIVL